MKEKSTSRRKLLLSDRWIWWPLTIVLYPLTPQALKFQGEGATYAIWVLLFLIWKFWQLAWSFVWFNKLVQNSMVIWTPEAPSSDSKPVTLLNCSSVNTVIEHCTEYRHLWCTHTHACTVPSADWISELKDLLDSEEVNSQCVCVCVSVRGTCLSRCCRHIQKVKSCLRPEINFYP